MECTKILAEELANINHLRTEDCKCLRMLITDFFAASFAGYGVNRDFNRQVETVVMGPCLMDADKGASVFMSSQKIQRTKAAFMNAVYAHGAELDDGHKGAMGHAGTHVIPAVFALAEELKASWRDTLLAIAVGYEAYIRVSSAAQPGMVKRGFHSTGMAGAIACAAGCGKLYGLDAEGMENAMALATTMSGGLLSYGDSRPEIKPLNPARAAEAGLLAASFANEGMKGPAEALEGPNGWFHAVTDHVNHDKLLRKESDPLLMHGCYYKLYPSCRHTHCGIEAAIDLHSQAKLEEIENIKVFIYPNAIKLAGQISYPATQDETKFSIKYTLAQGLLKGSYGIQDMKPQQAPEEVNRLIKLIELVPDEGMEKIEDGIRGARVLIEKKDGSQVESTVMVPKGDPEKPLGIQDIEAKLLKCSEGLISSEQYEELKEYIRKCDSSETFSYPGFLTKQV